MSIVSQARDSAATVLDRSKVAAGSAPGQLAELTQEALSRAARVAGNSHALVSNASSIARKQTTIGLGLTDAVAAILIKRGAELPDDVKQGGIALTGALVERRAGVLAALRTVTLLPANAVDARDKLAERGEQVATDLRHDPVLVRVITTVDERVERVANDVTSVAQKLRSRVAGQAELEKAAATATPVRLVPARKIQSHKTTVRKTPAGEAPVAVVPTYRAAAHDDQVRADAAAKAAATRKEAELARERANEARKVAAAKAAATRKKNAQLADAKRHATAVKAAATRKKNASAK